MYPPVRTKNPATVQHEVEERFSEMFGDADRSFVSRAFNWAEDCFTGRYRDYQAVDARYHDFEHTLQGTLCMVRLLHGRHISGVEPKLDAHLFQLGLLAILLHDTGYLKQRTDNVGTGAKYTVTHVARSADFAALLLQDKKFASADIASVQNMIRCTGVNANFAAIPFRTEMEKLVGFALATGDLLGQMAADDYIQKLPILYSEFEEAARFSHDSTQFVATFSSADDLINKTPAFWTEFVQPKLLKNFVGLYRFLNDPYPDGPNEYFDRISANIEKLRLRTAQRK